MKSKKLTDKQIKEIIAMRAEGASFRALARKYKIAESTVRNYCLSDEDFAKKCAQKKDENAQSVLAYMDTKKDVVCRIIDECLNEMTDSDRLSAASLKEIATVMGIVIDKFTKTEKTETADTSKLEEIITEFKKL